MFFQKNSITPDVSIEETEKTLKSEGIHLLIGDIEEDTVGPCIEWILEHNKLVFPKREFLQIYLSTSGGNFADGFALIDVIRASEIPIHIHGIGGVSSTGIFILSAGERGYRTVSPFCTGTAHHISLHAGGTFHEHAAISQELKASHELLLQFLLETTGIEEMVINRKLLGPNDNFLVASDFIQLGIADKIK